MAQLRVWRICRAKHEATAFTGEGAKRNGGRWNHKGHPLVYTSEHLSLAMLELLVHISPKELPDDLVAICGILPGSVKLESLAISQLPRGWNTYPPSQKLRQLGTEWLSSKSSVGLTIPSAINPKENNVLLNPSHPDMKRLRVLKGEPISFDPRLFKR